MSEILDPGSFSQKMKKEIHHESDETSLACRIEARSYSIAISASGPEEELARRLASILHPEKGREELGTDNRVPKLRSTPRQVGKTVAKMAVASRTHRKTPKVESGMSKVKQYWMNMTREQRVAEMRRRQSKWSKAALKKWKGPRPKKAVKK